MKKIFYLIIIIINLSCEVSKPLNYSSNENTTTLGLLDRLRSIPGLRIGGVSERDAQVYLRGQTSIKLYKEVVFYVNGARVGNYSSAYQVVQPENIDSIRLLKSASQLSLYGADGRDGVILIKTKN
jgi:TonB-dependent SusC/RagA subfamily outer membrane receptor